MEVEILVAEVGHRRAERRPAVPHPLRRHRHRRGRLHRARRRGRRHRRAGSKESCSRGPRPRAPPSRSRSPRSPAPTAAEADDLEVAVLDRVRGRRAFRRIDDDELASAPRLDRARALEAASARRASDHGHERRGRDSTTHGRIPSAERARPVGLHRSRRRTTDSTSSASSSSRAERRGRPRPRTPATSPTGTTPSTPPRSCHDDALGAQPGRDHLGLERATGRGQAAPCGVDRSV